MSGFISHINAAVLSSGGFSQANNAQIIAQGIGSNTLGQSQVAFVQTQATTITAASGVYVAHVELQAAAVPDQLKTTAVGWQAIQVTRENRAFTRFSHLSVQLISPNTTPAGIAANIIEVLNREQPGALRMSTTNLITIASEFAAGKISSQFAQVINNAGVSAASIRNVVTQVLHYKSTPNAIVPMLNIAILRPRKVRKNGAQLVFIA